jgi:hypothetical protein
LSLCLKKIKLTIPSPPPKFKTVLTDHHIRINLSQGIGLAGLDITNSAIFAVINIVEI